MNDVKKEWFETDYYKVLGVDEKASQKDITKAYRKLARQYHPDANPGDTAAEERFKEVSGAYDVVGDEETRKRYDEVRRLGPLGGFAGGRGGPGPGGAGGWDFEGMGDLGDLLGSVFGGSVFNGGFGGQDPRAARPRKGADQNASLSVDFAEAVSGMTTEITVNDGSGPKLMKIRIPAGVEPGQKLRLKGKGGASPNGGPNGDLIVTINVGSHKLFGRKGRNLTLEAPITVAEAAFGADIEVPTLGGDTKKIRIPKGTKSGAKFRVRDVGVPASGAKPAGDLIVEVVIEPPTELSDDAAEALRRFAELDTSQPRTSLFT